MVPKRVSVPIEQVMKSVLRTSIEWQKIDRRSTEIMFPERLNFTDSISRPFLITNFAQGCNFSKIIKNLNLDWTPSIFGTCQEVNANFNQASVTITHTMGQLSTVQNTSKVFSYKKLRNLVSNLCPKYLDVFWTAPAVNWPTIIRIPGAPSF